MLHNNVHMLTPGNESKNINICFEGIIDPASTIRNTAITFWLINLKLYFVSWMEA